MRLDINLATRPYEDARQFWLRWGTALGLVGILTLYLLYATISGLLIARQDRAHMREWEAQIAARDAEKQAAETKLNLPENRTTRDRSQFLNDLFERKSFSWTKVFEDLERVMPPQLHVVSIRPELSPENQLEIKLAVAGESRDRAIELVKRMEGSQHFQQSYIERESTQQGQTSGDNVQFDITAQYVPDTDTQSKTAGAH